MASQRKVRRADFFVNKARFLFTTAASRTPPWLPSGWGCRDRRLS